MLELVGCGSLIRIDATRRDGCMECCAMEILADGSCLNAGLAFFCTIVVGAIAFALAGAVDDSNF